jgi:hypothetical protein
MTLVVKQVALASHMHRELEDKHQSTDDIVPSAEHSLKVTPIPCASSHEFI